MRTVIIFLACIAFSSCSKRSKLVGSWSTTYFDNDAITNLEFFFNDFDLYDPPSYIPVIRIGEDSIEYALGVGFKDQPGLEGNTSNYSFQGSKIVIFHKEKKQSFKIEFSSKQSFCLFNGPTKVVCFSEIQNLQECLNYEIDLLVRNEYFSHRLFIRGDGDVLLFRSGIKSDTVSTQLNPHEKDYLDSLLRLVDFEEDEPINQSIGGDYTEYRLMLKCDNGVMIERVFLGLRDISFGTRALLSNLESFSKKQF